MHNMAKTVSMVLKKIVEEYESLKNQKHLSTHIGKLTNGIGNALEQD